MSNICKLVLSAPLEIKYVDPKHRYTIDRSNNLIMGCESDSLFGHRILGILNF